MPNANEYRGTCFCGAVEVQVSGQPTAMGYCHCDSCRHWSAGPVNAFTLWPPDAVTFTRGADKVDGYSKNPTSVRKWCKVCGGHLLTEHPLWGLTDVYAAIIKELPFTPMLHVNYENTVLRKHDGLVKQKDFPADMGGSGTVLPE